MPDLRVRLAPVARRLRRWQNRLRMPRGGSAGPEGPTAGQATAELAALTDAKDHQRAVGLAERHLDRLGSDRLFLKQVRSSAAAAGAMSLQRRATALQLASHPDPKLEVLAARLEGRWRETSADWSPTVEPEVAASLPAPDGLVPGRVVHVLKISMPHRQSGYSMRTLYTLTGQLAAGLDPVAVTALDFPVSAGVSGAPAEESVGGVRHLRLLRDEVPRDQPYDAYLDDWATALAPVVARERPQVIHVHSGHRGYESALVAMAVGDLLDVPVVYEVRGFFESLWTSDLSWAERSETYRRRRETETRCMRRAAAVVTLSESMRQDIVARGVDPAAVHVVPNGVDTDVFAPRDRSEGLVRELGLEGRFVFGYVSNLDHYREGQELLVEAAVELRRRGVPATALIVGDGARRPVLERRAAELGAGDAVVFTGRVPHEQVLDYYALHDVFVVPRVDERAARLVTPLKPFEAMAMGLPLLVSDLPALREITGGGSRGVSFRTGDSRSLADEVHALYQDPERRRRLGVAGREWVVAERQWSANGDRYRRIYDNLLATSPTSG